MADIEGKRIEYQVDGTTHVGYFAHDPAVDGARPGVLVLPEWWGIDDYIRGRADRLAGLGYAALAVDMYGEGTTADRPDRAGELMNGVLGDMATGTKRLKAGYELLVGQPQVDASRTAAIGYCFGGAMALHMARLGMPLAAVVSFHGALGSFHTPEPGSVKAKILVCHGDQDAMVSREDLDAFRSEMDAAGADYRVIVYPGALHGFTNPEATSRGEKYGIPLRYDADADAASWQAMRELFDEVFA